MKSNEEKQKFLEILKEIPFVCIAAKRAGIDKATIYRWKKDSPAFARQMTSAQNNGRETINDLAESQVVNGIRKGEYRYVKYWLGNNCKRYVRPRPINIFAEEVSASNKIKFVNFNGKKKGS